MTPSANCLFCAQLHGVDEKFVKALQAEPVRLGEGAVGRAAVERVPIEFSDIEADAYESRLRSLMAQAGFRSVLNVPLLREERIFGGLSVCRNSPGRFPTQVVDLLQSFATQSVLAIQNARLFKEIDEWSRTLERRVNEQLAQLERLSSLKRFFAPTGGSDPEW